MTVFSPALQGGLEGRYRVRIAWQYETVEFLGLPYLQEERPLTLAEIYVPLSLTWEVAGTERQYVPDVLEQQRHLVVLGDPGSGKSTLIKLLAYSFGRIEPTPLARRLGAHLPIPIILRDYPVRAWHTPEDMLGNFIAQLDAEIRAEVTVSWLLDALSSGRGALLLDGLDEVGGQAERAQLRDQVVLPLLERMPQSLAVLTSRVIGYEEAPFDGLAARWVRQDAPGSAGLLPALEAGETPALPGLEPRRCYVAPFNEAEIDQFISKWYTARERDERERQRRLVSLREALARSDRIRRLASNPSLLTLMTLIHRVTAELPSGRVKLYDKIVEAYLETIQRYRGLTAYEASLEEMKRWLAQVGWHMQSQRAASADRDGGDILVSREQLLEWLRDAIATDRPDATAEAESFLDYIARRSGLLIPRGPQQFAFVHLTFQEYFAAWHLRAGLHRFDQIITQCAARMVNARWHETLVLLFELLAEFPGIGNDLADALQQRVTTPEAHQSADTLFAELLLDTQSGLSWSAQQRLAGGVLEATCAVFNEAVIERLHQLTPQRFDSLVRSWIEQQWQAVTPETIGADFFLVVSAFPAYEVEWSEKLAGWVAQRGGLSWSTEQIYDVVLTGGSHPAVCAWGVDRLPLVAWFAVTGLWFDTITLADLYVPVLLRGRDLSARHRLLTQLGTACATSQSHLLHAVCWSLLNPDAGQTLDDVVERAGAGVGAGARAWARATSSPAPAWLGDSQGLASDVAWAEQLFFTPEAPPDLVQPHREALERLATAPDDWSRLLGLTSLMLLGAGTPERCAARNALLDKGMQQARAFTFPEDVQAATATSEFPQEFPTLLRRIFLHEPGKPWLQPAWFDPAHPAAQFFRATPREFFARAALLLDPEGTTDLARWRL